MEGPSQVRRSFFYNDMNKKLTLFLSIIAFVFAYTVYESIKLDNKLSGNRVSVTGDVISQFPDNIKWKRLESGQPFSIDSVFKDGLNVVVHFWATWCAPCEVEFPEIVELARLLKEKKNIVFLFVAVNDKLHEVQKFLNKFDLGENIILLKDDDNQYKRFGTYKMPETYLFDSTRVVIKKYSGQHAWSQSYLVDFFKAL